MKEQDIRPDHLLRRYLELSAIDAETCFGDVGRISVPCVACGSQESRHEFKKSGFPYVRCGDCGTLYQCPRPPISAFERFYRNSESSRYWSNVFFPAVA